MINHLPHTLRVRLEHPLEPSFSPVLAPGGNQGMVLHCQLNLASLHIGMQLEADGDKAWAWSIPLPLSTQRLVGSTRGHNAPADKRTQKLLLVRSHEPQVHPPIARERRHQEG